MKRLLVSFTTLFMLALTVIASAASDAWKPAVVTQAAALGDSTGFTIRARVRLPQPCYEAHVAKALILIYPPHYVAVQRRTAAICTDVITSRTISKHFNAKPWPKAVDLYALDASGHNKHWVLPIIVESR